MVGEGAEGISAEWREELALGYESLKRAMLNLKAGILGRSSRRGRVFHSLCWWGQKDQGLLHVYDASGLPYSTAWSRSFSPLSDIPSHDFPSRVGLWSRHKPGLHLGNSQGNKCLAKHKSSPEVSWQSLSQGSNNFFSSKGNHDHLTPFPRPSPGLGRNKAG